MGEGFKWVWMNPLPGRFMISCTSPEHLPDMTIRAYESHVR
jgi:hypothetical protein